MLPAESKRSASLAAAPGKIKCSGAKRLTNRAAAAKLRATRTAPFFASERHAGFDFGSCASCSVISAATARPNFSDVVTKIATASGWGAADARNLPQAQFFRGGQEFVAGLRAGDNNIGHAGFLRRNRGH